jgi:hypothetical protein
MSSNSAAQRCTLQQPFSAAEPPKRSISPAKLKWITLPRYYASGNVVGLVVACGIKKSIIHSTAARSSARWCRRGYLDHQQGRRKLLIALVENNEQTMLILMSMIG